MTLCSEPNAASYQEEIFLYHCYVSEAERSEEDAGNKRIWKTVKRSLADQRQGRKLDSCPSQAWSI